MEILIQLDLEKNMNLSLNIKRKKHKRMTTTIIAMKWVGVMTIVMLFTIVAIPIYSQLTTEQEQEKRRLQEDLEKNETRISREIATTRE